MELSVSLKFFRLLLFNLKTTSAHQLQPHHHCHHRHRHRHRHHHQQQQQQQQQQHRRRRHHRSHRCVFIITNINSIQQ